MPWFYFDLLVDDHQESQGGMILENLEGARDRADALADELRLARSALEGKHCQVRVINESNEEVYRTSLFADDRVGRKSG
jgi:hypothetical protein